MRSAHRTRIRLRRTAWSPVETAGGPPPSGRLRVARAAQTPTPIRTLLRRPAMWGFITTTAAVEFCRGALFISLLPAYLTDARMGFGVSVAGLGMVVSGQYFADTIFKAPAGWLVDRFGPWPVLLPFLSLSALAVWLLPHAHTLPLFVLLGVLFGLGGAANWPAVLSGSVHLAGMRSRASATSITFLAWLAGGGPGPVLINFVVGRGYGRAFALLGAVATAAPVAAALGLLGILHSRGDPPWEPHLHVDLRASLAQAAANLRQASWLLPGTFVQMLALGVVLPVLVPFSRAHLHIASQTEYGLFLLAGGAVTVFCLLPFSRLVDRVGSRTPLIVGFSLAAAAVAMLSLGSAGGGLLWRVALLGFSYALILPAWNGLQVGQIDAGRRGLLLGLFMAIEGLGIAVGSATGGTLYTLNYRAPFLGAAAILAAVAVFYSAVPAAHFRSQGAVAGER